MERFRDIRRLLVAVDDSENAGRAVRYVADLLGGVPGVHVTVLTVIPDPPADHFGTDAERRAWVERQRAAAAKVLEGHRMTLLRSGFPEDSISSRVETKFCPSVADCVLDTQRELGCGTLVVGRRGISKSEEFLFGSTSSRIVHSARGCVVWVVE